MSTLRRLGAGLLLAPSLFLSACSSAPPAPQQAGEPPARDAGEDAPAPNAVTMSSGRDPAPTAEELERRKQDPQRRRRERVSLRVEERTLETPAPAGLVDIEASGPVTVVGADRADVGIRAEIGATTPERLAQAVIRAEVQPDGSLRVFAEFPEGAKPGEAFIPTVELPRACAGVRVRTPKGEITLRDAPGDADLESGAGEIRVVSQRGGVVAATQNSRILIERPAGSVEATTANAGIEILDAPSGVLAQTTNAAIRLRLASRRAGTPFSLSAPVGAVLLEIPDTVSGRVAVEPSYTPIEVDPSIPSSQSREARAPTTLQLRSDAGYLGLIKAPGGSVQVRPARAP